ncbi:MAG: DoxX family protein [Actinomycetota bacterium]
MGTRIRGLVRFALASPATRRWEPLIARIALAAVFIPAGLGKFVNHDAYITRFDRWGFPAPGSVAYFVGTIEVVCGIAMLLGVAPRLTGAILAGNMVGALVTAGRIDGGMNLWLPPLMIALAALVAVLGAGRHHLPSPFAPAASPPAAGTAPPGGPPDREMTP